MVHYFIIPGLGNSGPEHWQTYFENSSADCKRIEQQTWESPRCDDWIARLEKTLSEYDLSKVVLVGHSLGCLTIIHWALRYGRTVRGALLVAPSDLEVPQHAAVASGFTPIPVVRLPFKSIVVASTNDPWVSMERARLFAEQWGSELVDIGDAGHINVASGHGAWPEGLEILRRL